MNETELRLAKTLIETGRLKPEQLEGRQDGQGIIDALLDRGTVDTAELESILKEMPPAAGEPDPLVTAINRLERYTVLGELGRGGMGRVYLAYDTKLKRSVALKAMRVEDPKDADRYKRELEIAAGLRHPNIAAIHDAHTLEGIFVIAMQYVEGKSLDGAQLTARESMEAVVQAARAVHSAHDKGIIHRDLKPANLMRTPEGHVYVLDFGIARRIEKGAALTQTGSLVGTPAYMSPEQARGRELDARTDVYSLGATLYTLLSGRVPFEGASVLDVLEAVLSQDPKPIRRVHRDIETIVLKAMAKDPAGRYPTAKALADDLQRFLSGEPIEARPISTLAKGIRFLRRRPWVVATLVVLMAGIGVVAGVVWNQRRQQARLAEANRKIDEATRKIDEWDQLIYLPPRDLTPHQALLKDAIALCDGASTFAGAHYQKARALTRLGDLDTAEKAISAAVAIQPEATFYRERARIRLRKMTRELMNPSGFADLQEFTFIGKTKIQRMSFDRPRQIAREVQEDLSRARPAVGYESAYVEAMDLALRQEFEQAGKVIEKFLPQASPWEQADLHQLRAWMLLFQQAIEEKILGGANRVAQAKDEITQALAVKESDADLYYMRSIIEGMRASPMNMYASMSESDKDLEKAAERWVVEARKDLEASRSDAQTVLRIRPGDPDAGIHLANLCLLDAMMDLFGNLNPGFWRQTLFEESAGMDDKLLEEIFLPRYEEGERLAREVVARHPNYVKAWICLIGIEEALAAAELQKGSTARADAAMAACNRALALAPDPFDEEKIRLCRVLLLTQRSNLRGDVGRRAVEADLAWLKAHNPETAAWFEDSWNESALSGVGRAVGAGRRKK